MHCAIKIEEPSQRNTWSPFLSTELVTTTQVHVVVGHEKLCIWESGLVETWLTGPSVMAQHYITPFWPSGTDQNSFRDTVWSLMVSPVCLLESAIQAVLIIIAECQIATSFQKGPLNLFVIWLYIDDHQNSGHYTHCISLVSYVIQLQLTEVCFPTTGWQAFCMEDSQSRWCSTGNLS